MRTNQQNESSFFLSLSMLTFSGWSQNFWKKEDPKENFIKSIQELHYRKSVPKSYEIYSVNMISLSRDLKNKTVVKLPNGNDADFALFPLQI